MNITVICDNNPYKGGLETGWGFSCLVTGMEKGILFDTGPGQALLDNMEKLAIKPSEIDIVFLSHIHGDHSGGLNSFLEKNPDVTIYLPKSFPQKFKTTVQSSGAKIVEIEKSLKICEDAYSTGQVGGWIKEQSLIIRTDKGLVIITGCAHPGIIKIVNPVRNYRQQVPGAERLTSNGVNTARDLMKSGLRPELRQGLRPDKDNIHLLMGGFHLEWATKGKIEKIISAFKQMGVRYIAPAHCTGEKARSLFEEHFGKNYINIGVGKIITLADLS